MALSTDLSLLSFPCTSRPLPASLSPSLSSLSLPSACCRSPISADSLSLSFPPPRPSAPCSPFLATPVFPSLSPAAPTPTPHPAPGSSRKRLLNARASNAVPSSGAPRALGGSPPNSVDLCIFPFESVPLPTSSGSLSVFEPHLVALVQVIQHVAAAAGAGTGTGTGAPPARFGALPSAWVRRQMDLATTEASLPASFLEGSSAAGMLQFPDTEVVGCCCVVDAALEEPDGEGWWVQHRAVRRFRPLQVLRRLPFLVVRGEWLDDDNNDAGDDAVDAARSRWEDASVEEEEGDGRRGGQEGGGQGVGPRSTGELEVEVWEELQEVEALTARLSGRPHSAHDHSMLPASVSKFAPLVLDHASPASSAPLGASSPWALPSSQMVADMTVWRKMRSAAGAAGSHKQPTGVWALGQGAASPQSSYSSSHSSPTLSASSAPPPLGAEQSNPYWNACERASKASRQEAFSFAAASVIDLGPVQREELLSMTDTSKRLSWVLEAIAPYLASLRAECAMRRALGDM